MLNENKPSPQWYSGAFFIHIFSVKAKMAIANTVLGCSNESPVFYRWNCSWCFTGVLLSYITTTFFSVFTFRWGRRARLELRHYCHHRSDSSRFLEGFRLLHLRLFSSRVEDLKLLCLWCIFTRKVAWCIRLCRVTFVCTSHLVRI